MFQLGEASIHIMCQSSLRHQFLSQFKKKLCPRYVKVHTIIDKLHYLTVIQLNVNDAKIFLLGESTFQRNVPM